MKKFTLSLSLVLVSFLVGFAQAPPTWLTYYGKYNLTKFADNGNSLLYLQTTQLVQFDKTSGYFQYTAIPNSILPCLSDHDTFGVTATGFTADQNGNVWMSTLINNNYGYVPGALYKYDGSNWISFAPTLTGAGLEANLMPTFDHAGNMWFNSPSKGLVRYNNSTFATWDTITGHLPSQTFLSPMVFDQNNNLWVGTVVGVVKFDGTNFTLFDSAAIGVTTGYGSFAPSQIFVSPSNNIYLIDNSGFDYSYYSYNGTAWTNHPDDSVVVGIMSPVQDIFFDASGNSYICYNVGIMQDSAGIHTLFTNLPGYQTYNNNVSAAETDAAGTTWMYVNGTLASFSNGSFTTYQDPRAVLESNIMLPQVLDQQGNQWLGFWGGGGLDRRSGYTFTAPIPAAQSPGVVDAMAVDNNGMVWFGANPYNSVYSTYPVNYIDPSNDSITSFPQPANHNLNNVAGITVDKNNNIWIVADDSLGSNLLTISGGVLQVIPVPNLVPQSAELSCITADSSNNIWMGTQYVQPGSTYVGLIKYDGSTFTNYSPSNSSLPDSNIQTLAVDPINRLWIGTWDHGFTIFDGSTWTTYDTSNSPLPCNHVEWFTFQNGKSFICTQLGFCIFDGTTWTTYTPQNSGLVDGDCESMVVDNQCNVWAATECGLSQLVGECNNPLKILYGKISNDNNTPVAGVEVFLMKLDSAAGMLKPINNVITDAHGNYSFATEEPTVYVHAEPDPRFGQGVFAGYEDTALVQQQSAPVHMGGGSVMRNVALHTNPGASGLLSLTGRVSSQGGGKPGGLHLYLMQNGAPVATAVINVDGSFGFSNLRSGTYTIWVDKMSVDNSLAPTVTLGANSGSITALLHPTYLQILTTGMPQPNPDAELRIYPNPSTGKFNYMLNGEVADNATLNIYSISGQLIYSTRVATGLQTLDLSALANGVYLAHVVTANASYEQKVVIER